MLEHEDFRSRLAGNCPSRFHELLISVPGYFRRLEAGLELGATEQKFNLSGPRIQREYAAIAVR